MGPAVGQQTAPPASRKEIAWHGVRFQYDPQRFLFAEATPSTTAAWAAADLTQTPNPCLQFPNGADCFPDDIGLRLYSRDGLSFWAWLAQQKIVYSYTPEGDFVETHIAGQPAVAWPGDSIFGGSYTAYAMPLGEDVLLIGGWGLESFVSTIELEHPPAAALAAGQTVMTTPGHVWELWSDAAAGERLVERPLLYGGAYVTILAVEPQAVQVRTSEGLTGWIHAAAADALIAQVAPLGEQARFIPYSPAKIADGHTLPLRESPRSTAPQRDPLLESGQEVEVIGARGDWLQVYVFPNRDGSPRTYEQGWVRWYYDGTEYIDVGGR